MYSRKCNNVAPFPSLMNPHPHPHPNPHPNPSSSIALCLLAFSYPYHHYFPWFTCKYRIACIHNILTLDIIFCAVCVGVRVCEGLVRVRVPSKG